MSEVIQKPSLLKKIISYLIPIKMESVESKVSGRLEVFLNQGRYSLCTAHAMYSFEDLYHNFLNSFKKISLDRIGIKNVLVLGVGLCSVPLILEKKFLKKYKYAAVDIDAEVIKLAKKYATPKLESEIEFFCEDAFEFVKKRSKYYDLIIVDLFIDDLVPEQFEQEEFMEHLKQISTEKALIMYNRVTTNEAAIDKTNYFFEHIFKKVFKEATMLDLGTNKMFLSTGAYLKSNIQ
jgi:spermidine synthase